MLTNSAINICIKWLLLPNKQRNITWVITYVYPCNYPRIRMYYTPVKITNALLAKMISGQKENIYDSNRSKAID